MRRAEVNLEIFQISNIWQKVQRKAHHETRPSVLIHLISVLFIIFDIKLMPKDISRWELRSVIRACSIFLIVALIIKTWIPLDRYYDWSFNRLISRLVNFLGVNRQPSPLPNTARTIGEPQFNVADANPFDVTRLICFITLCFAITIPFLL